MRPVLTIRTRVALAYTLVFGLMLSGFAFLVYRSTENAGLARLDASLESHAGKIQTEIEEQWNEHLFPLPAEFNELATEGLAAPHVLIRTLDGSVVLSDSLLASAVPGGLVESTAVRERCVTSQLGGKPYRIFVGPAEVNDSNTFVLYVAAPMEVVETGLIRLRLLFLLAIPAGLVLASLAGYGITRAAFTPLTSMIATARRISADNLGARLDLPATNDEIRLLGTTLNGMMDRIQKSFEAQRQFVADASHEIRTPLTIIRSDLEFLQTRVRGRGAVSGLDDTVAEVDRLAKMADNLLLLSRLDAAPALHPFEQVRLDEVLVECVQGMDPLFRSKGVHFRIHIAGAVEMRAHRESMKRVVLNLLDNSLKFTRRRGRVTVTLAHRQGEGVCVTVGDTGCGIAPHDLPHIFDRFFRAGAMRGDGTGSGLGLAIVDHLVRMHDGIISVESELGKGTTVLLRFPERQSA